MVENFWPQAQSVWTFIASGIRDAALSAIFTSILTVLLILIAAKLSGRRLSAVEVGGVNLQFAAKETQNAYVLRGETPPPRTKLVKSLETLSGRWKVLWVDDHPENNRHEMEALSAIGFSFQIARSNEEAVASLKTTYFNLVISDIGRDSGESGSVLPEKVRELSISVPFVFYIGSRHATKTNDGYPVTITPQELFNAIRDQLGITDL